MGLILYAQLALAVGPQQPQGNASEILPLSLGKPAGCFFSDGRALNNGSYPGSLIVVGGAGCPGRDGDPYYWQNNQWKALEVPEGNLSFGYAESVSDGGAGGPSFTTNWSGNPGGAWVQSPGPLLTQLPLAEGTNFIDNALITADGNYIVGGNSAGQQAIRHAVRWARDGDAWLEPAKIGPGKALAATADGRMVIGNTVGFEESCNNAPWVWTDDGGSGSRVDLSADAQAYDITHNGSMIVGCRRKPCADPQACATFPAPVYWIRQGGQWLRHDLEALDGVDSEAVAVAEVGGQPVILGYGFTNQSGGILRVVVWIPNPDGSYGAPLRLEALGGNFESWSWPTDINRNGIVLGWSETAPFGEAPPVLWSLFGQLPFQMNAGLSDAWYNPATNGQGFFIIVWEEIRMVFLAWFTYELNRPPASVPATLGEAGHRWLTAEGTYTDDHAELTVYLSEGGVFDSGQPAPVTEAGGFMMVEFDSCLSGTVTYDIPSAGVQGVVPIQRITHDHVALCESRNAQAQMPLLSERITNR